MYSHNVKSLKPCASLKSRLLNAKLEKLKGPLKWSDHVSAGTTTDFILRPLVSGGEVYPQTADGLAAEHRHSEEQLETVVEHEEDCDQDAGELEDGDLVSRCSHSAEARCGTFELRAHGGEGIGLEGSRG